MRWKIVIFSENINDFGEGQMGELITFKLLDYKGKVKNKFKINYNPHFIVLLLGGSFMYMFDKVATFCLNYFFK